MMLMCFAPTSAPPALVVRRDDSTAEPTGTRFGQADRPFFPPSIQAESTPTKVTAEAQWVECQKVQDKEQEALRRQSYRAFWEQIRALFADEEAFDDDCLAPTMRSVETTFDLLAGAAERVEIPRGTLYPDGKGGLRIEWHSGEGDAEQYVLLSVHPFDERQDYIYYQQGSVRGHLQTEITSTLLTQRLQRLGGSTV